MDITQYIQKNLLKVIAKPNSSKTEIISFDESRQALRIAIAAVPDKDKANTELLKFLKRQTGSKCRIKSCSKSREKIIEFF